MRGTGIGQRCRCMRKRSRRDRSGVGRWHRTGKSSGGQDRHGTLPSPSAMLLRPFFPLETAHVPCQRRRRVSCADMLAGADPGLASKGDSGGWEQAVGIVAGAFCSAFKVVMTSHAGATAIRTVADATLPRAQADEWGRGGGLAISRPSCPGTPPALRRTRREKALRPSCRRA